VWGHDINLRAGKNNPSQYKDYVGYYCVHKRNAIITFWKIYFKESNQLMSIDGSTKFQVGVPRRYFYPIKSYIVM
jgi:hypothetical protein